MEPINVELTDQVKKEQLESFMNELGPLLDKYNCDLIAKPYIDNEGKLSAQPLVVIRQELQHISV